MQSCLYVGQVRHRRFLPRPHHFRYGLFMVYLDLAELGGVFSGRWFWSVGRRNLAWFNRADYLGDPAVPLDAAVRDLVEGRTGRRPAGPIRLLTHLRYFGYCFNPVSFYYSLDEAGERLETLVTEITNTPWKERHSYVLSRNLDEGRGRFHRYRFAKDFHVSPFFPMDLDYDWRFQEPGATLSVHMSLARAGLRVFDAALNLNRQEITTASLALMLVRFPLMTFKVVAGIYWQAALLRLKRTPFFEHPDHTGPTGEEMP